MTDQKPPDPDSIFEIPDELIDEDDEGTIESPPLLSDCPKCNRTILTIDRTCRHCGKKLKG